MKRTGVLKKFDKEIESLWDVLYNIKDLLENTDDYELAELAGKFLDQISEGFESGDITIEEIRDQISG
tara:strand:+ start:3853 stop:4056 length:204 start_codon:yes stop_codon:yes gene_type:complete